MEENSNEKKQEKPADGEITPEESSNESSVSNDSNRTVYQKDFKTILIIGVSSMVGSNLAEFYKNDYQIVGTYYKNRPYIEGITTIQVDVLVKEEIQLAIFTFRPQLVIYAVGLTSIEECSENPNLADALNTVGLINVSDYCQRYKTQICLISSAFVFGGNNKDYIEMDIPDSNTTMGKTIAASEFYIQKTSLNYIVFRCCRLYGRGTNQLKQNWFEKMQKLICSSHEFTMDNFVKSGFLNVDFLALLIKLVFESQATNRLFQICNADVLSMYEFSQLYAEIFSENKNQINKGRFNFPRISTISSVEKKSEEFFYKLDTTNIEGYLNIKMPSIEDSLKYTFQKFNGAKKGFQKGKGVTFI